MAPHHDSLTHAARLVLGRRHGVLMLVACLGASGCAADTGEHLVAGHYALSALPYDGFFGGGYPLRFELALDGQVEGHFYAYFLSAPRPPHCRGTARPDELATLTSRLNEADFLHQEHAEDGMTDSPAWHVAIRPDTSEPHGFDCDCGLLAQFRAAFDAMAAILQRIGDDGGCGPDTYPDGH